MILRGWKDICEAAGGMSEDTARQLMLEEGFPVTIVARKPMSTSAAIEIWVQRRCLDTGPKGPSHSEKETTKETPKKGGKMHTSWLKRTKLWDFLFRSKSGARKPSP